MKKTRKRVLSLALTLVMVLTLLPGTTLPARAADGAWDGTTIATGFAGGTGIATDPYQIATGEQFAYLAQEVNAGDDMDGEHFLLTNDIDLDNKGWTPIGADAGHPFKGYFDGGGHTVSGLYVAVTGNSVDDAFAGLFGELNGGGIENLKVEVGASGVSVSDGPSNYAGGLLGRNNGGSIANCSVSGDISATGGAYSYAGGLAGININGGSITNCYATGDAAASGGSDSNYGGGLLGRNNGGSITNCYATGKAAASGGTYNYAGGLLGWNNGGSIVNCYATGRASATDGTGSNRAGGLAGVNGGSIANCYAAGGATASGGTANGAGGLAGYNYGTISYSYWNTDEITAGHGSGTLDASCAGMTLDDMKTQTFADTLNSNIASLTITADCFWYFDGATTPILLKYYDSGTGISTDPYIIKTEGQLRALAVFVNLGNNMNGEFIELDDDIDLTGGEWAPIGDYNSGGSSTTFNGSFDGGGFTVSGLTITDVGTGYVGLFGIIDTGGSVNSLRVEGDINIQGAVGYVYAGGLVGWNGGDIENCLSAVAVSASGVSDVYAGGLAGGSSGTITNCYATGNATAGGGSNFAGGIAGSNIGAIEDCSSAVEVRASGNSFNCAGGIAGYNEGDIENCYATASITTSLTASVYIRISNVGGIAGYNEGDIENCYATGSVTSSGGTDNNVGGIVGFNYGNIENCYAVGSAMASGGTDNRAGDLVGWHDNGNITNCYYNSANSPGVGEGDDSGVTGLTRDQMTGADALTNMDFTTPADWVTKANTGSALYYPQLAVFVSGTQAQKDASLLSVTVTLTPSGNGSIGGSASTTVTTIKVGGVELTYTKDADGLVTIKPTEEQIKKIIAAAKDGVITFDLSGISGITGLNFEVNPAWFDKSGDTLLFKLGKLGTVEINDKMMGELGLLGGKVVFTFKQGSLIFDIRQDGKSIGWYNFKNPVIISMPSADTTALMTDKATGVVIARSWYADGNVYAKVYTTGEYELKSVSPQSFSDTAGKWMDTATKYMAARGVVNGIGGDLFAPERNVTRAEFLTMLMRALDPEPQGAWMVQQFGDIPDGAYYYDYALKGKAMGIVSGTGDNLFNPDATITRQDMFTMLYRAMELMNMTPEAYTDQLIEYADWGDVSSYAADAIQNLSKLGLVSGYDGNVNPVGTATRAEAAQVIYNVLIRDAG